MVDPINEDVKGAANQIFFLIYQKYLHQLIAQQEMRFQNQLQF